jgi:nitronate monooxygenase
MLEEWLKRITSELKEHDARYPDRPAPPFAVNQIVHRSNERLAHDLEVCTRYEVPVIITSLGARENVNAAVHSYGGVVFHDVMNQGFARKVVEKGADGLILVAAGAGGHAGTISPFAFVQETRQWFDGPIALSGSIATGQAILGAEAIGADFAYIGSAFIATTEANAPSDYKQAVVDYNSGVHGNYLRPSIAASGLDPDNLPESDPSTMNFGSGGNMDKKAWKDIWGSGQGIGAIRQITPAGEFVGRLEREYFSTEVRLAA